MINVSRNDIILDTSYWVTLMCSESGPEVWWEQLTWDKCASTCFHLLFWKRCRNEGITWTSCKTTLEAIQPSRMFMPYPYLVSPCLWLWLWAESLSGLPVKHSAAGLSHVHIFTCTHAGFMLQYPWKSIGLLHLSCLLLKMQSQTMSVL